MMRWLFLLLTLNLMGCIPFSSKPWKVAKIYRQTWVLGDTPVVIQREDYGPGKIFVHVHANETTALEAARLVARTEGGQVVTLVHAKTRNIEFHYHGLACGFDPNRIYTDVGIAKTLTEFKCNHAEVRSLVKGFARKVLQSIPAGKIVAVHNNHGYSLLYYLPHHSLAADAQKVYYNPKMWYRNFYFVTEINDFERYRRDGFNVVLQSPHVSDDGSMAVYFRHRQYANIEAGYTQLFTQMRMIKQA